VAVLASRISTVSASTVDPPTISRARLSTRMSAKNTPWVGLLLKSPERSLMQNVWPSTSVTSPDGSPRLVGSVANTHGLGCTVVICGSSFVATVPGRASNRRERVDASGVGAPAPPPP
jgi:hypothetical protein